MEAKGEWWTCPTQGDNGGLVMVTGRRDVEKFKNNPRFNIRVDVSWKYGDETSGMPSLDIAETMEKVTEQLRHTFDADPVAVMTGIYTGEGRRDWVFYTLSTNIFGRKLNEALAPLPLLPISIYCENDPSWDEYEEMKSLSEINASDD